MRDNKTKDLYAWDESPDNTIALFSTHEFLEQLNPPDCSIERLVANAVTMLTASIDANSHKTKPKDCPQYYNNERDVQWVAGPLRFCERDEELIDPKIRVAVKALLRVY